jgi:RimJ/RimL family protein N-acetyltransferase
LKLLFEYAFKIQWMRKIDWLVYSNNPRALHVYKKLWFQEIWRYKNHNFKNWEFVDAIIIEMFKEEFVI